MFFHCKIEIYRLLYGIPVGALIVMQYFTIRVTTKSESWKSVSGASGLPNPTIRWYVYEGSQPTILLQLNNIRRSFALEVMEASVIIAGGMAIKCTLYS